VRRRYWSSAMRRDSLYFCLSMIWLAAIGSALVFALLM
jgi:hypothetical protein